MTTTEKETQPSAQFESTKINLQYHHLIDRRNIINPGKAHYDFVVSGNFEAYEREQKRIVGIEMPKIRYTDSFLQMLEGMEFGEHKFDSITHPTHLINRLATHYYPYFKQVFPDYEKKHRKKVKEKNRTYSCFGTSQWTNARVHNNWSIPLHLDQFYGGGYCSTVFVRDRCVGGHLIFPEYRLAIKPKEDMLIFQLGSDRWHGVADIKEGYRLSVAFY